MKVVVKESLANGRLSGKGENDEALFPSLAKIRELAESRGTSIETLALAAALARPWADIVLTGAATVSQINSNFDALDLPYDDALDDQLRSAAVGSAEYWRSRSSFRWN
jgi:aryl-alcohol dehydrogenase-like predicted oxidoreductase